MQKLYINGENIIIDSTYTLRWVENVDKPAIPVLYKNGKRVVKTWNLVLNYISPEDPYGENANTN